MKCISCGSEIPNNSQSCPFCGENIIKNETLMETATLPVTPSEIQLPSDQAKMANTGAINIVTEEDIEIPNMIKDEMVESIIPEENIIPKEDFVESEVPEANAAGVQESMESVINSEPVVITGGTIDVDTGSIEMKKVENKEPEMETVTFGTEAKEATDPLMKKQFPLKLVLIILAIAILGCGGYFGFYYFTQYTTSTKRIDAVIDTFFDGVIADTKNEKVEKQSAKFNAALNYTQDENIYKFELDGNYGIDLKQKLLNFALNIKDLRLGEEVIIDKNSQINLKTFVEGDTISIDLPNFFDKYISSTSSSIGSLLNSIEQNDVDYKNMFKAYKNAFKAATKELDMTQDVSTVTFNNKKSKANVISIPLTASNQEKFYNKLIDSLLDDKLFVRDYSLFMGVSENELIASLNESKRQEYKDLNHTIEICTALYAEELIGIRMADDDMQINFYGIDNGYALEIIDHTKKVFEVSYSSSKVESVNTIDNHFVFNMVINGEEGITKINLDANLISDINPVIERKDEGKETIPAEYLDEEAKNAMLMNILNYGKFGAFLQQLIINLQQPVIIDETVVNYEIELPENEEINIDSFDHELQIEQPIEITY